MMRAWSLAVGTQALAAPRLNQPAMEALMADPLKKASQMKRAIQCHLPATRQRSKQTQIMSSNERLQSPDQHCGTLYVKGCTCFLAMYMCDQAP